MENYWLHKSKAKHGDSMFVWDSQTEGLSDSWSEKREALFCKCVKISEFFGCSEVRVSQKVCDLFFSDISTYYWPEREEYPLDNDGPRRLRFTKLNMFVYPDCPKDIIMFKWGRPRRSSPNTPYVIWDSLRIINLFDKFDI